MLRKIYSYVYDCDELHVSLCGQLLLMGKAACYLLGAAVANSEIQDLVLEHALMETGIGVLATIALSVPYLAAMDFGAMDHPKFPRVLAKWACWSYTACTVIYVVPLLVFSQYYKATRGLEVLPMSYEEAFADAYRLAAVVSVVAVVALGAMLSQACLEKAAAEGGTDAKLTAQGA